MGYISTVTDNVANTLTAHARRCKSHNRGQCSRTGEPYQRRMVSDPCQLPELTMEKVLEVRFSTDGGRCRLSKPANKGVALLLSKDGDQVATFQEQEGTIGEDLPAQHLADC